MRAYYYANVEMIDNQVGNILNSLEERGNMDNTIVIFTSDHGDNLGDHGLIQKWAPYEEVTRVPLIISAPKRFKSGRNISAMIQLFDLAPTILYKGCLSFILKAQFKPVMLGDLLSLLPVLKQCSKNKLQTIHNLIFVFVEAFNFTLVSNFFG